MSDQDGILTWAFKRAMVLDPKYRAAEAGFDASMIDAKAAGSAYYPQLSVSRQQAEFDDGNARDTVSILQPIVSADRFATMREKKPRAKIASLTLENARYELALRLFASLSALTAAREGLTQNDARLDALQRQLDAANRAYELGQGTRTDIADAQVKVLQARADDLSLKNELNAAKAEFESMAGAAPSTVSLKSEISSTIDNELASTEYWVEQNLDVQISRLNVRLGELAVFRSRSSWIPEVNGSLTYTSSDGTDETFSGMTFTLPVQAGNFYGTGSAKAQLAVTQQEGRDTEREARLTIERLDSFISTGLIELTTRRQAIEAAELSVDANSKSYEGGVRSLLDLLTSIEVLYAVQNEYVLSALKLGENLLNLRMLQGRDVLASLTEVENLILETGLSGSSAVSSVQLKHRPVGPQKIEPRNTLAESSQFDFD